MSEETKEQKEAREKKRQMYIHRDALGHLQLKLGMLSNDMPIEKQLTILSDYHNIPDVETIKRGENQIQEGYINDIFREMVKTFFEENPSAYELLDEKSDDILIDYAALGIKLYLLTGDKADEEYRKDVIRKYFSLLPYYEGQVFNHIHFSQNYELIDMKSSAFEAYFALHQKHQKILDSFKGGLDVGRLISDAVTVLYPEIITLKEKGVSQNYYDRAVGDMILAKFNAYAALLIHLGKGVPGGMSLVLEPASKPLGINGIYNKLEQVESTLELSEDNRKLLENVKTAINSIRKATGSTSSGGCFGTLLLLLTAASGLVTSLIFIF